MENEKKIDLLTGLKEELTQSKVIHFELTSTINLLKLQNESYLTQIKSFQVNIGSKDNEISKLTAQNILLLDLIEKYKIQITNFENEMLIINRTNQDFKTLNSNLSKETALVKKELIISHQNIEVLKNSILNIEQSFCWKITKPIRLLVPIKLTNWLHQLLKHYKS